MCWAQQLTFIGFCNAENWWVGIIGNDIGCRELECYTSTQAVLQEVITLDIHLTFFPERCDNEDLKNCSSLLLSHPEICIRFLFTSGDITWPPPFTKYYSTLSFNMINLYTKYEKYLPFLTWDNVFTGVSVFALCSPQLTLY